MRRATCLLALLAACGSKDSAEPDRDRGATRAPLDGATPAGGWTEVSRSSIPVFPAASLRFALIEQQVVVRISGAAPADERPEQRAFREAFCEGLEPTELTCAPSAAEMIILTLHTSGGRTQVGIDGVVALNEGDERTSAVLRLETDTVDAARLPALAESAAGLWYAALRERIAELTRTHQPSPAVQWDVGPAHHARDDLGFLVDAAAGDTVWSFRGHGDGLSAFRIDRAGVASAEVLFRGMHLSSKDRLAADPAHARVLVALEGGATEGGLGLAATVAGEDLWVLAFGQDSIEEIARLPGKVPAGPPVIGPDGATYLPLSSRTQEVARIAGGAVTKTWKLPGTDAGWKRLLWLDARHLAIVQASSPIVLSLDVTTGKARQLAVLDPMESSTFDRVVADGAGGVIALVRPTQVRRFGAVDQASWLRDLDAPFDHLERAGDLLLVASATESRVLGNPEGVELARWPKVRRGLVLSSDGTQLACDDAEVVAIPNGTEVARAPMGRPCVALWPRADGSVAVTFGGEVLSLGPPTSW